MRRRGGETTADDDDRGEGTDDVVTPPLHRPPGRRRSPKGNSVIDCRLFPRNAPSPSKKDRTELFRSSISPWFSRFAFFLSLVASAALLLLPFLLPPPSRTGVEIATARNRGAAAAVDLSIFDRCSLPPASNSGRVAPADDDGHPKASPPPCVYFRPTWYFSNLSGPDGGGRHGSLLAESGKSLKFGMWSKQVNDWRRRRDGDDTGGWTASSFLEDAPLSESLSRKGVRSASSVLIPKVGSRSIERLFLETLGGSSASSGTTSDGGGNGEGGRRGRGGERTRRPRVGVASFSFWSELERRRKRTTTGEKRRRRRRRFTGEGEGEGGGGDDDDDGDGFDVAFALVRDPVDRFLSSIAQTLFVREKDRKNGGGGNDERARVLGGCLATVEESNHPGNRTKKGGAYGTFLRCVIDAMMKRGANFFDQHLVPQSTFLRGALGGSDVELAVFHLDSGGLDAILKAFGAGTGRPTRTNVREDKSFGRELTDLFGTELLDAKKAREALHAEGVVRDVCRLYEVDVEMIRFLGFPVTSCDG